MSYLLPTSIILMLLIGTATSMYGHDQAISSIFVAYNYNFNIIGRTRPSQCGSSSSSSSYYSSSECGDSYCIERYYVCDGRFDCLNGRDEFNCGEHECYQQACINHLDL